MNGNYAYGEGLSALPRHNSLNTIGRWQESLERYRMLRGSWRQELDRCHRALLSNTRANMSGPVDMTKNVFRSIVNQLSVLYDGDTIIRHENEDSIPEMRRQAVESGLWQLMAEVQNYTVGQRECAVRVMVDEKANAHYKIFQPFHIEAEGTLERPDEPVKFWAYSPRMLNNKAAWTAECFDISDLDDPKYTLTTDNGEEVLDEATGSSYPFAYEDGTPFIPFVLYHARKTGHMFDPYSGIELKEGALRVAVYLTFWGHVLRDASWPQRYMIDGKLNGVTRDNGDTPYLDSDPSSLMSASSTNPEKSATMGQFQAGGDVRGILESIDSYCAGLATDFDISPGDIQRASGDARSGYAIHLTREGQRRAQEKYKPQFARGDADLLGKTAALINRQVESLSATSPGLPEQGWSVKYHGIPLSLEERRQLLEEYRQRVELGVMSRAELLSKLDGVTVSEAREKLKNME